MEHSFDVEIAKAYDIPQAILLKHIYYWVEKNKANNQNLFEGRYWTYNSARAFAELFPYMSKDSIKRTIKKMVDNELIIKGNYNENKFDRSNWYALTDKGLAIVENCSTDYTNLHDTLDEIAQSEKAKSLDDNKYKPNINTNIYKRNIKENLQDVKIEQIIQYLNDKLGTRYTMKNKQINGLINGRLSEGKTVDDFITVIDKKCAEWQGTNMEQYLRPSTLFAPSHFEEYLNQTTNVADTHSQMAYTKSERESKANEQANRELGVNSFLEGE